MRTVEPAVTCGITLAQQGRVFTVAAADELACQLMNSSTRSTPGDVPQPGALHVHHPGAFTFLEVRTVCGVWCGWPSAAGSVPLVPHRCQAVLTAP